MYIKITFSVNVPKLIKRFIESINHHHYNQQVFPHLTVVAPGYLDGCDVVDPELIDLVHGIVAELPARPLSIEGVSSFENYIVFRVAQSAFLQALNQKLLAEFWDGDHSAFEDLRFIHLPSPHITILETKNEAEAEDIFHTIQYLDPLPLQFTPTCLVMRTKVEGQGVWDNSTTFPLRS